MLTHEQYDEMIKEKDEIIQTLNEGLDEANTTNAELAMQLKAAQETCDKIKLLQDAYNEVCEQRDILIKVLGKTIL